MHSLTKVDIRRYRHSPTVRGLASIKIIISTDEDPSLQIESSVIINVRGVSTKLYFNKYKDCCTQINISKLKQIDVIK